MAVDAARAKSLFLTASDLADPAERAAYLERECGGDAELRARVEALLAADGGGAPVLDEDLTGAHEPTSAATLEATAASRAETCLPSELATAEDRSDGADSTAAGAPQADRPGGSGVGQVIAGRYTLLDVLGEGGMGTVYRAGQAAPVKRQVALKLIKVGMDSRAVLARFDAERQALALMDHPNIARVYDGGSTESGQPFFVMELVSGEPITDYCDRKRLTVRARLGLFVAVCQAVQHAHQKGIIHRDLKPSNVMVTEVDGRPTPKVIDFGVAKATEFSLTDQSLADTGAIVGTPTYMSPEQADPSSMDIDTRTDVYALGVILYELLAGSTPLDAKQFKRGAILEMLRMVREVDPPSPSTKVSTAEALPNIAASRDVDPAHLKRALQGDLDWIVMMALEKDRTRRYETANGFAADVQRHLAHEPVVAAPPSRAYRLRKFVRKHRGAVIAASLVLVTLLGGLAAVAAVQTVANARLAESLKRETSANAALNEANGQLSQSRAAVQARYELATDAIKAFHTGVSEDFLLKEEKFKELRNRLLKSASNFYGKLSALLGKETDLASRRTLAQANFALSDLTDKVGRTEDALAAHRHVLAAREALAAESGTDVESKVDVGRSLTAVAKLLQSTGKIGEAGDTYHKAETLLADLARSSPTTHAARAALAACRTQQSSLLYDTGKSAESLAKLRLARADQEALAAVPGASNEARNDLAGTIFQLAVKLWRTGQLPEAEAEIRAALPLAQKLAADEPAVTQYRARLADMHHILALVLDDSGKKVDAQPEYREGLMIMQKVSDENPAVTEFRRQLFYHHDNLAICLYSVGKLAEAEAEYRKGLAVAQKLVDDNPGVPDFRVYLAGFTFAYVLWDMGKESEAETVLRGAIPISQKLVDDYPANTRYRASLSHSYHALGYFLGNTGRPAEAEALDRQGLAALHKLAEDDPKVTQYAAEHLFTLNNLGAAVRQLGRPAEAQEILDRAVALSESKAKENPEFRHHLGGSLWQRGLNRIALGDYAGAAADARRGASAYDEIPGRRGLQYFDSSSCHALLVGLAGKDGSGVSAAEGQAEADKAMALLRKAFDLGFRNARFRTEPSLDSLRQREDFQKLLAELEQKSAAKPK